VKFSTRSKSPKLVLPAKKDKIKADEKERICRTNEGEEECIENISGKTKRKGLLRKPRSGWLDNIKLDLREMVLGVMD
jgi:hypothetical protein